MPMYEYTCRACGESFEQLVKSMTATADEAKVACPKCASTKTRRAMSVFAVSSTAAGGRSPPDVAPMCGRCGGPGPCAGGG